MAILFDDGSDQYLERDAAAAGAFPISIAAWFNSNDATNEGSCAGLYNKDAANNYVRLDAAGDVAGDPVRGLIVAGDGGDNIIIGTTTGWIANTWNHACLVAPDADHLALYHNGGGKTTDTETTLCDAAAFNRTSIGRAGDSSPRAEFSGSLAEVAMWNVALTDAEVFALAQQKDALQVRPESLVSLWRLYHVGDLADIISGYNLTAYNAPQSATHPLIMVPEISIPFKVGAAPTFARPLVSASLAHGTPLVGRSLVA